MSRKHSEFPEHAVRVLQEAAEAMERGAVLEEEGLMPTRAIEGRAGPAPRRPRPGVSGVVLDLPACDRKYAVCRVSDRQYLVIAETCKRGGIRHYEVVGEYGNATSAQAAAEEGI